ncbi:ATP-binding protein [Bacillus sp. FSL K6-3431]|uniref:ATP-binding protein n=1 Tax=Bacillus sp. FSL K6-3431 TaxID=2921500 RepID=UPI0030F937A6
MRRIIAIILSIGIFLITLFSSFHLMVGSEKGAPNAEKGKLDLYAWDFEKKGILKLNGEWEFYSGELIFPQKNKNVFTKYSQKRKVVDVPGSWDSYLSDDDTVYGIGTYRLVIQVPQQDTYGIEKNTIRHASRLFINSEEVGASGVPSKNLTDFRSSDEKYIGMGGSAESEIEIVVHVANYYYPTGGIIHSLEFGTFDQIMWQRDWNRALDTLLISGYLLFGIYYFLTFFQRKSDVYQLYFSLFCLLQSVYLSTLNERIFSLVFPNIGIIAMTDLQMFLIHSSVFFFLMFIYKLFEAYANKKVIRLLSSLLAIQVSLYGIPNMSETLLSDVSMSFKLTMIVLILSVVLIYVLILLIKAFINRTEGSEYILIIVTTFCCYGLLLGLDFLFEIAFGKMPVFLFLVMIMNLSLLMGYRFQFAYKQVDQLSKDLLTYDHLKDEFLLKTAHELRTPLHGILNLSKSLMEGNNGPLRLKQQENVVFIHNLGKRLVTIAEDLLHASKIKQGQMNIYPKILNIKVIEEVLAEVNYLIPPSEAVKVINTVSNDLPLVYVDEQQLKQIVFNLMYNAIKFTKQGEIIISAEVDDEELHISISDTGVGMDEEHLALIFTSFYQVEGNFKGESKGLGLGLSIAKQLVEALGGRIWVTSEFGKGSCFTLAIPLANESQMHDVLVEEKENIFFGDILNMNLPMKVVGDYKYTILVVNDEHVSLKEQMDLVTSLNYTVIAVDNGEEAIKVLNNETIDMMIIDLAMSKISGYEVCKIVRKDYHSVELPIIILTAAGKLTDLSLYFDVGANDFLHKPIQTEQLKTRVESLLAIKKSAQDAVHDELSYFYAQITPHFLYNTLNTIIGLSYGDVDKAREALEHLSIYFRAKLDFYNHNSLISIKKEMELVKSYLSIEQMRYRDRLTVYYDIDESAYAMLPSMTIQPLVENAVQHGIAKRRSGGSLWISIQKDTVGVKIVVKDDGIGIPKDKKVELLNEKNDGIGFTNTFKKLKLMKKAKFSLESDEGKGTKVTIILPEVKHNEGYIN